MQQKSSIYETETKITGSELYLICSRNSSAFLSWSWEKMRDEFIEKHHMQTYFTTILRGST